MNQIAVIDYGMGNLRSVAKALEHVCNGHAHVLVTSDPRQVRAADRVVFPGQGAMPDCMREMDARGLREAVIDAAANKPFLGICIGLQMLFEISEEGEVPGLNILPGKVVRFRPADMHLADGTKLKVPHMGWNEVERTRAHALWDGIADRSRFYFVHSYHPRLSEPSARAAVTYYPSAFDCAVARENLFAVQFHPEKSQAAGLRLLNNFISWKP